MMRRPAPPGLSVRSTRIRCAGPVSALSIGLIALLIGGLATVLGAAGSWAAADETVGIEVTVPTPGTIAGPPTTSSTPTTRTTKGGNGSDRSTAGHLVTDTSSSTVFTTVLAAGHDGIDGPPGSDVSAAAADSNGSAGSAGSTAGPVAGNAAARNGITGLGTRIASADGLARTGAPLATMLATSLVLIALGVALTALAAARHPRAGRRLSALVGLTPGVTRRVISGTTSGSKS